MIVILRFDHAIAYFSPFAAESTGRKPEDVLGRDFRELFLDEADRTAMAEQVERLNAGERVRDCEVRIRCHDGTIRLFVWNADRLDDYEGAPAILITALDITARKRAEERVLQAERLAAIGEAMTGLIHESRNALQRSSACLEMLQLDVEDRPEALELVNRTLRAQLELQRLYEEVRQYAAPMQLSRESANLCGLCREVWHNLSSSHTARELNLVEEQNGVDASCNIDRFAMGQVWRNILENAIQASPAGGKITVRCDETALDERPAVRISFTDEGAGLTPDQKKRIFEPFFTTKTKGTGLGMAIAERIVQAHGGHIAVGESSGPGAQIVVTLPRE